MLVLGRRDIAEARGRFPHDRDEGTWRGLRVLVHILRPCGRGANAHERETGKQGIPVLLHVATDFHTKNLLSPSIGAVVKGSGSLTPFPPLMKTKTQR